MVVVWSTSGGSGRCAGWLDHVAACFRRRLVVVMLSTDYVPLRLAFRAREGCIVVCAGR